MQTYGRKEAEQIINDRISEFDISDDGIRPIFVSTENAEFDQLINWTPACEIDGDDAPDPQVVPGLPIRFFVNHLGAWFIHGGGSFVRQQYGDLAEGPDPIAMARLGIRATKAKQALKGAFDAIRAAETVVGAYDKSYAERIQELEKQCGPWLDFKVVQKRIAQAWRDSDDYEADWRKKMVNQLLRVETLPPVDLHSMEQLPDASHVVATKLTTATSAPMVPAKPDVTLMATREQLIVAFGAFTGMDATWFANLKDTPKLLAARKVAGQGGRGHITEPLFCPFAVLQWLIDPVRRKGRKMGQDKGWERFESHFPRAYAAFSVGDTRSD